MVRVPTWEPSVGNLPGASNVPHATPDTFGAQIAAAQDYAGRALAQGANQFGDVIGKIGDEQSAIDAKVKTSDYEAAYNNEEIRLKRTIDPAQMHTLPDQMKAWHEQNWKNYQPSGRYGSIANGNVQIFQNQKNTHQQLYVEQEKDKYIPQQIMSAAGTQYGAVLNGGPTAVPAAADAINSMISEATSLNEFERRKLQQRVASDLYTNTLRGMIERGSKGLEKDTDIEAWTKNGLSIIHKRMGIGPMTPYGAIPQPGSGVAVAAADQPRKMENGIGSTLTGKIVVNGHIYEFISGGGGRGSAPIGQYTVFGYTSGEQRRAAGNTYVNDAFPLNDAHDPGVRGNQMRTGLLIHSARYGATAGCIGIRGDFEAFKKDMQAELAANGGKMRLNLQSPDGSNVPSSQSLVRTENAPRGQVTPGTINQNVRSLVATDPGAPTTISPPSIIKTSDNKFALVPQVSADGKLLSEKDALAQFRESGAHMGIFENETDAAAYAKVLHEGHEKNLEVSQAVTTAGHGTTLVSSEGTSLLDGMSKSDQAVQDHGAVMLRAYQAQRAREMNQVRTVVLERMKNESPAMKYGGEKGQDKAITEDVVRGLFGANADLHLDRRRADLKFYAGPGQWTEQTPVEQMVDDLQRMNPQNIDPQSPAFKHWVANYEEGLKHFNRIQEAYNKRTSKLGDEKFKAITDSAYGGKPVTQEMIDDGRNFMSPTQLTASYVLRDNPPTVPDAAWNIEAERLVHEQAPEVFNQTLMYGIANRKLDAKHAGELAKRNGDIWREGIKPPLVSARTYLDSTLKGDGLTGPEAVEFHQRKYQALREFDDFVADPANKAALGSRSSMMAVADDIALRAREENNDNVRFKLNYSRYFSTEAINKPRKQISVDDLKEAQAKLDSEVVKYREDVKAGLTPSGTISDFATQQRLLDRWINTVNEERRRETIKQQRQQKADEAKGIKPKVPPPAPTTEAPAP